MATVIRYINPASSGGDGTTNALSGVNAAYASMNSWEAAEQTDLVSDGDIHEVRCEGTGDTGAGVLIEGWTTGVSNYIYILVEAAHRHNGTWNTGKYYLEGASSGTGRLTISQGYFRTKGLQVRNTQGSPSGLTSAIRNVSIGLFDIRIDKCIKRDGRYTFRTETNAVISITNSIAYGGTVGAYVTVDASADLKLYSCDGIGVDFGIYAFQGTITAKNCYAKATTAYATSTGTLNKTTCASSDTTGSAGLQNIAYSTTNFVNVTGGSEDLNLKSGSTLIGNGTDTSGEGAPLNFTDDIIGTERGGTWDVGAFEFISAAGGIKASPLTLMGVGI